jgi:hypothetical protein
VKNLILVFNFLYETLGIDGKDITDILLEINGFGERPVN